MDLAVMPELKTRRDELLKDIDKFKGHYLRRHRTSYVIYNILALLGLATTVAITAASLNQWGAIIPVLAVFVGFIQGLQQLFPVGQNAEFYRLIVAESENLAADLKYKVDSENEFQSILDKFQTLRAYAAIALPRGKGMESVKKMYDDLASRNTLSRLPSTELFDQQVNASAS